MIRWPEVDGHARENYWYDTGGFSTQALCPPLKRAIVADIAIVGGGFTGLAAAYNLIVNHPDKKIVLLEAACCGCGASGRSGGFADTGVRGLDKILEEQGPEEARRIFDITLDGLDMIRQFSEAHDVNCEFAPTGSIELANEESHILELEEEKKFYDKLGLEATLLDKGELQRIVKSDRYVAGLRYPYGATVNPYKLTRGMKRVVEHKGVDIYERTPVFRVEPGKDIRLLTEMGEVRAPAMVLATDGYSPSLGFFKHRVIPMCAYVIATAPLTKQQRESIGWAGREKLSDLKVVFDYFHLSGDDRIVFGGGGLRYLYGGRACEGVHEPTIRKIRKSLFATFPQLEGIEITHQWGGTLGMSLEFVPSVGVMGEHMNIYYAVAYSGEGTVLSQVAGKIISALYSGQDDVLARLFFVNMPVPYSWPDPIRYVGVAAFKAYYQWLRTRPIR